MFEQDRILTLNIGAGAVTLAEFWAEPNGVPTLRAYGIGSLDMDPENESGDSAYIVAAIRDLLSEHAIRPAPVYMTVSGQAVFSRYVKLPPVARDKVAQIIRYEAEQNVPFPFDEMVWDYQLISESGEGDLSAMLAVVKTDIVMRLTDCVMAAGLEPEIVDAAPMALYNTLRYNYPDLQGCTMILDIGARSANLIFAEGPRIFSRSIPVAGNAITNEVMKEFDVSFAEAEALKQAHAFVSFGGVYAGADNETADRISKVTRNVVTRLHAEVNRSINFYRSQQGGQPPSLTLLTGGSSVIPHLDTFFREKLKAPVDFLNPFLNVSVDENIDTERVHGDLHRLGEVTGLALRRSLTCPVEINLLPPQLAVMKNRRKRKPFFALAGAALILIALSWWLYFYRMGDMRRDALARVEERVSALTRAHADLQRALAQKGDIEDDAAMILNVVGKRTQWVEIVRTIYDGLLDGMWIASLRPQKDSANTRIVAIELTGKGFHDKMSEAQTDENTTPLSVFRDRLRTSPLFSQETELRKTQFGRPTWDFTLWLVLGEPISLE